MLSFIVQFDVSETFYLHVCGNMDFHYSYSRYHAILLLATYHLNASFSLLPLPDLPPSSLDSPSGFLGRRTWIHHGLRSTACSRRVGHDSSRSSFPDADQRHPSEKDAAEDEPQ